MSEPVTAAIAGTPEGTLKEMARAAQKLGKTEHAYQKRPGLAEWAEWKKAQSAYEEAGLAYARACAAVFK